MANEKTVQVELSLSELGMIVNALAATEPAKVALVVEEGKAILGLARALNDATKTNQQKVNQAPIRQPVKVAQPVEQEQDETDEQDYEEQ